MFKSILLCGTAVIIASLASPVMAQSHPKPSSSMEQCTPNNGGSPSGSYAWRDVGEASPWRQPYYSEVGNGFPYNESSPVVSCGDAARQKALECYDVANGSAVDSSNCTDNGSTANDDYAARNPGWTVRKNFNANPAATFAFQQTNLGNCQGDGQGSSGQYQWQQAEPSTAGVCGTKDVPVAVKCVDSFNDARQMDDSFCDAASKPATTKSVTSQDGCGYDWTATAWTDPAASCGQATRTRDVACIGPDGNPASEQSCLDYYTMPAGDVNVIPTWSNGLYPFPIGSPNPSGNNIIIYRMPSQCQADGGDAIAELCDFVLVGGSHYRGYLRPKATQTFADARTCAVPPADPPVDPNGQNGRYAWNQPAYVAGAATCGPNTKTGSVFCTDTSSPNALQVDDSLCDAATKPPSSIAFDDASACAPTPTSGNGASCVGGTTVSSGSGDSVRNWPDDLTSQCTASGGNCFEDTGADLHDGEQNSYSWTVHSWTCKAGATSVASGPDGQNATLLSQTSTPTPTPPGPVSATTITVGYCRYTSSGGGRYACGPYENIYYSNNPSDPPKPEQICTGSVLGSEDTPYAGPNWQKPAVHTSVPAGTQCIIDQRIQGYSDDTAENWSSIYYSGPPSGLPGGLYIK